MVLVILSLRSRDFLVFVVRGGEVSLSCCGSKLAAWPFSRKRMITKEIGKECCLLRIVVFMLEVRTTCSNHLFLRGEEFAALRLRRGGCLACPTWLPLLAHPVTVQKFSHTTRLPVILSRAGGTKVGI